MSTITTTAATSPRRYSIQDRRRVLNLYSAGHSVDAVAARMGMSYATVRDWVDKAGRGRTRSDAQQVHRTGDVWRTPEVIAHVRRSRIDGVPFGEIARQLRRSHGVTVTVVALKKLADTHGIVTSKPLAQLRRNNSPATPEGRVRIERIRTAARLAADGLTQDQIAEAMGIRQPYVSKLLATPYAKALATFVHGNSQGSRAGAAIAMHDEQGLPVAFIAKVLDADEHTVNRWLVHGEARKRPSRAGQSRARKCATTRPDAADVQSDAPAPENPATVTDDGDNGNRGEVTP